MSDSANGHRVWHGRKGAGEVRCLSPTSVARIHHGHRRLRYKDRNRWMERRREAGSAVPDNQGVSIKPFASLLSQYQFGPRCPTDNHPLHGNSGPRCSRVTKQQQDASNAQTTHSLARLHPPWCLPQISRHPSPSDGRFKQVPSRCEISRHRFTDNSPLQAKPVWKTR